MYKEINKEWSYKDNQGRKQGVCCQFEENTNKFMIANFVDGLKQGRGCSFVFRGPHRGHLYEGDFENDKYQGVGQY